MNAKQNPFPIPCFPTSFVHFSLASRGVPALWASLLAACLLAGACTPPASTSKNANNGVVKTAATAEKPSTTNLQFSPQDIEELKSKFTFNEETGWYHHKHWGTNLPKRRTLTADVMRNGYFLLCSNYYAPEPLEHRAVEVTLGETTYQTREIDIREKALHKVRETANGIYELNYYSNYGDEGIFEKIGLSDESTIKIRFIGENAYTKAELPRTDLQALRECFQLSLVLRQLSTR